MLIITQCTLEKEISYSQCISDTFTISRSKSRATSIQIYILYQINAIIHSLHPKNYNLGCCIMNWIAPQNVISWELHLIKINKIQFYMDATWKWGRIIIWSSKCFFFTEFISGGTFWGLIAVIAICENMKLEVNYAVVLVAKGWKHSKIFEWQWKFCNIKVFAPCFFLFPLLMKMSSLNSLKIDWTLMWHM